MKNTLFSVFAISLLAGCATAEQQIEQEKTLAGEWICHSVPTEDKLTFDRLDHFILKSDGSAVMRARSSIEQSDKEIKIRYLLQAKAKWRLKNKKLIFDFTERSIVPAHSKSVAEAIKRNPKLQEFEKEYLDSVYSPGTNHVALPIKFNGGHEFIWGNKAISVCHKVNSGQSTKELKLLDNLFKNNG